VTTDRRSQYGWSALSTRSANLTLMTEQRADVGDCRHVTWSKTTW